MANEHRCPFMGGGKCMEDECAMWIDEIPNDNPLSESYAGGCTFWLQGIHQLLMGGLEYARELEKFEKEKL